jgi:hypothetical protein
MSVGGDEINGMNVDGNANVGDIFRVFFWCPFFCIAPYSQQSPADEVVTKPPYGERKRLKAQVPGPIHSPRPMR